MFPYIRRQPRRQSLRSLLIQQRLMMASVALALAAAVQMLFTEPARIERESRENKHLEEAVHMRELELTEFERALERALDNRNK